MTTASKRRASRCSKRIAREIAREVWVVAPEHDQSGVSHAVSLHHPIRVTQRGPRRYGDQRNPGRLRGDGGVPPDGGAPRPISCCAASIAAPISAWKRCSPARLAAR